MWNSKAETKAKVTHSKSRTNKQKMGEPKKQTKQIPKRSKRSTPPVSKRFERKERQCFHLLQSDLCFPSMLRFFPFPLTFFDLCNAHARSVGEVPGRQAQGLQQSHIEDSAATLDALPRADFGSSCTVCDGGFLSVNAFVNVFFLGVATWCYFGMLQGLEWFYGASSRLVILQVVQDSSKCIPASQQGMHLWYYPGCFWIVFRSSLAGFFFGGGVGGGGNRRSLRWGPRTAKYN